MTAATSLRTMLERDEGNKLVAYPDPVSHGAPWTIGRGHTGPNVHEGTVWTEAQSDQAFEYDMTVAIEEVEAYKQNHAPWIDHLNDARLAVMQAMVFQMGLNRTMGFVKAWQAARLRLWATCRAEMEDSDWFKETPDRCKLYAEQMETGEWK